MLAASDSSSAGSIVSQKVVNLRMTVDSRPGVMSDNKIEDLAFEVSSKNLDMLILEFAQAQQMKKELDV